MKRVRIIIVATLLLFSGLSLYAQEGENIIDQVIAVVGGEKILLSDIEQEIMRMKMQGIIPDKQERCRILEQMLTQKLLLTQAKIDSIEVKESSVESEMKRRLDYFSRQLGSEEALENYFNKTIYEIKDDLRELIREQLLTQQMRQKIISKVTITPSEVKRFYRTTPKDSIPTIPEQYELQQIMIYPPASDKAKLEVKERLLELRNRVLNGERFSTLAVAYSEDRSSAIRGGELGFRSREELVKPFADAAFNLKEGQVSQIVESEYGFHIIQLIAKKGKQVNVRHILLKPRYSSDMLAQAMTKLDSIATLIKTDSLTFEKAAARFSQDKKSNINGGLMINPYTNTSRFEKEQLLPADFYVIKKLKEGEVSKPFESRDEHANIVFKIVRIKRIIPSHRASIDEDYDIIQTLAKKEKETEIMTDWTTKKIKSTFIRIDKQFRNCPFTIKGWVK